MLFPRSIFGNVGANEIHAPRAFVWNSFQFLHIYSFKRPQEYFRVNGCVQKKGLWWSLPQLEGPSKRTGAKKMADA